MKVTVIIPEKKRVHAPCGQVLKISLPLGNRLNRIAIIEMAGEINTPKGHLRSGPQMLVPTIGPQPCTNSRQQARTRGRTQHNMRPTIFPARNYIDGTFSRQPPIQLNLRGHVHS